MTNFSWFYTGQAAARREDAWKKHPFRPQFSSDVINVIQQKFDDLWIEIYRASALPPTHPKWVKITPEDVMAKLNVIDSFTHDRIQDVIDGGRRDAINLQLEMNARSNKLEKELNDFLQDMKNDAAATTAAAAETVFAKTSTATAATATSTTGEKATTTTTTAAAAAAAARSATPTPKLRLAKKLKRSDEDDDDKDDKDDKDDDQDDKDNKKDEEMKE